MCKHYDNFVKIKGSCCNRFYSCRFCHDENESHELNRYDVNKVRCQVCNKEQLVGEHCKHCGKQFATYSCLICALYSNDGIDEQIFHCFHCGICRKGGRSNYYHCAICNICIKLDNVKNHKCIVDCQSKSCCVCHSKVNDKRDEVLLLENNKVAHRLCLCL